MDDIVIYSIVILVCYRFSKNYWLLKIVWFQVII